MATKANSVAHPTLVEVRLSFVYVAFELSTRIRLTHSCEQSFIQVCKVPFKQGPYTMQASRPTKSAFYSYCLLLESQYTIAGPSQPVAVSLFPYDAEKSTNSLLLCFEPCH
jgi:hypothetical protein